MRKWRDHRFFILALAADGREMWRSGVTFTMFQGYDEIRRRSAWRNGITWVLREA